MEELYCVYCGTKLDLVSEDLSGNSTSIFKCLKCGSLVYEINNATDYTPQLPNILIYK